jgi:hypothetical protein
MTLQQEIKELIMRGIKSTNYLFINKPLVVGGLALEYYGIRNSGPDYDYMISSADWKQLKKLFPDKTNFLKGNTGTEIVATINIRKESDLHEMIDIDLISTLYQFSYDDLSKNAIEFEYFKIIDIEKLLLVKTLVAVNNNDIKSINDQKFIVTYIVNQQYKLAKI